LNQLNQYWLDGWLLGPGVLCIKVETPPAALVNHFRGCFRARFITQNFRASAAPSITGRPAVVGCGLRSCDSYPPNFSTDHFRRDAALHTKKFALDAMKFHEH
jgi:hypothetical protein